MIDIFGSIKYFSHFLPLIVQVDGDDVRDHHHMTTLIFDHMLSDHMSVILRNLLYIEKIVCSFAF